MSNLKWILIVIISFLLFSFFVFKKNKQSGGSEKNILTIAIFKTASHPSLDEAEKGFLDGLNVLIPETEKNILYYNAEGIMMNAHAIAQEITANKKITAFYTIGSLATQSLSFVEQKRPIIFAAVSNPKKLLNPKENNQNICGISDSIPTDTLIDFIKKTVPLAKKIGILRSSQGFNENECAAIGLNLEKNGIVIEHLVISQESDIDSLLKSYKVSQLDAIFSPADNLIASSINRISDILAKQKIPFLTSFYDENSVASIENSYYNIGCQAAQGLKIIMEDKKKPKDIEFSTFKKNIIKEKIITNEINCILFSNNKAISNFPIVFLGGSEGGRPESLASMFAEKGFCTAALGYFACEYRPEYLENINLEYFKHAIEFIKKKFNSDKVILIGNSRGGELALILGTYYQELFDKIIALVPSAFVNGGFPFINKPAWKINNNIIDFCGGLNKNIDIDELQDYLYAIEKKIIKYRKNTETDPLIIKDLFLARLKKYSEMESNKIKIEKINCPILLLSGEEDDIWPSKIYCNLLENRLKEKNNNIAFNHISFRNVGHGVLASYNLPIFHPIGKFWCRLGGNSEENEKANTASINHIIDFITS